MTWKKEVVEIDGYKYIVNVSKIGDLMFFIKKKVSEESCTMEFWYAGKFLGEKTYEKIRLAKTAALTALQRARGALNAEDLKTIRTES